jgi:hypothetical protein
MGWVRSESRSSIPTQPAVIACAELRDIVGEIKEENIGENNSGFCNLRVTFLVKRATR